MRSLRCLVLLAASTTGCFIDPSLVLEQSTPAACTGVPTTCVGTDVVGGWTLAQACTLAKTFPSCPKYEWSHQSVGIQTFRFQPSGYVDYAAYGRLQSTIVFDKVCSPTNSCTWMTSIAWDCRSLEGDDCECHFDATNNGSFDNRYTTSDGVITLNDTVEDYLQIRYCVDGDSLYFLYDHGGYERFRRG